MSWISEVEQARAFPVLPCRDQDATVDFHGRLGFEVDFRKPEHMILRYGPFEIHFRTEPGLDPAASRAACRLSGDAARRLFHEAARPGLSKTGEPPCLVDPDGNRLWLLDRPAVPPPEMRATLAELAEAAEEATADIARCPQCGSEFQPHVTVCIDCGAPTVPASSTAPATSVQSWQEPVEAEEEPDLSIPCFECTDLDAAISFFERLGFEPGPRDPGHALISLGDVEIDLVEVPEVDPARPGADCCVLVEDAARLYEESKRWSLPDDGAPRLESLRDQPWDVREYAVVDPYGNRIRVVQELPPRLGPTDLAWPEKDLAVCPACGAEFRAGVIRCLDCGARTRPAFSSSAPAPARPEGNSGFSLPEEVEGVLCYHHGNEESVQAFAERLAEDGVRSRVDWSRSSQRSGGQLGLLVAPGDLDRAIEILREESRKMGEDLTAPLVCPACGTPLPEGEVECPECGLVMAGCPECGGAVSPDQEQCARCGAELG
jgi:catechol 2,3-dioxygenase-like lactoylglutathione lyase family enzyme/ribosomal protein L32